MVSPPRNRGPAAAAANREALLTAARAVLDSQGLNAPLNAVARTAGVGQGSLYRHFPDRINLVLAVFDDNVRQVEVLAAEPSATLDDLLALLTRQTIDSVAFVDMINPELDDPRLAEVAHRVEAAIAAKLPQAHRDGRIRADLSASDITLAVAMIANLLAKTPRRSRSQRAEQAWSLIGIGLGGPPDA